MDKFYNRNKEDAEDSEERKTLVKNLMKSYFKKNFICYTLKNIIYIDKKSMKQRKIT